MTKYFKYNNGSGWRTLVDKAYIDSIAAATIVGVTQATLNDSCSALRGSIPNTSSFVKYADTSTMLGPYLPKWLAAVLYQPLLGFTPENVSNKVTTFSTLNNTLYPTTQAVANYVSSQVVTYSAGYGLVLAGTLFKWDSTIGVSQTRLNNFLSTYTYIYTYVYMCICVYVYIYVYVYMCIIFI